MKKNYIFFTKTEKALGANIVLPYSILHLYSMFLTCGSCYLAFLKLTQ